MSSTVFFNVHDHLILILILILLLTTTNSTTIYTPPFLFQGFQGSSSSLTLTNSSYITPDGLLRLTNDSSFNQVGHAFFTLPVIDRNNKTNTTFPSFSTSFVFAIRSPNSNLSGNGMTFALSPSPTLPYSETNQYLGLFNSTSNGNSSNNIVAVEFDTIRNPDLKDIDGNHVGIDVNSVISFNSTPASYDDDNGRSNELILKSGQSMQVWIDYYAPTTMFEVTLAPLNVPRPQTPLLSSRIPLSSILISDEVFVGFTAGVGGIPTAHYVLAWAFSMDGQPLQKINTSALPNLPPIGMPPTAAPMGSPDSPRRSAPVALVVALVALGTLLVLLACAVGIWYWIARKRRFAELIEEHELTYGPNRISYRDLYRATDGFKEDNLLGSGGFGRVFKGRLPGSTTQVAVKKISRDSNQGVREFVTEITSMARLRHKNLVQLIGYCRRKGELLLVYDYMENGSLDKHLYSKEEVLGWSRRCRVIRGVAEGLLYLHEGWEQVVLHRDVKSSNVLLDADFNGRLGDFGLAKIYDQGDQPQHTTRVVGTVGYLAPEMLRTGKATTFTDVFAFGAFILEVVCGERPLVTTGDDDDMKKSPFLVDRVIQLWKRGDIVAAVDRELGYEYVVKEAETMLKLGVFCSYQQPELRPTMRQVVQVFDGDVELPNILLPSGREGTVMDMSMDGETSTVSIPTTLSEHWSLNVQMPSEFSI